ncbi:regulation of nuclear pre-mRNA domain-containing protein 1B-like [Corticium candelabrum]|uniref:regulation of nuclear pre-mRNA domain-containing protein 1B-like n=1 Tax=Corticium candelabrum TaxID=121492 RepID=UPI002E267EC3|nr:regulation of nuclear pre-mRNA domain-containing protein 1B-like [Corticium candelabrum]
MSEFSVAASFERKAKEVTGSQQSIQTLSVWAIHHRKHAKSIVEAWLKELLSSRESKKLTLIYLANDIIQNSKRKGHEYSSEFGIVMAKALENVYQYCDDSVEKAVSRVLDIWEERGIYNEHTISLLRPRSYTPPYSPPPEMSANTDEGAVDQLPLNVEEDAECSEEPPDTETFLERLKNLDQSAASHDDRTRMKITNIAQELLDPSAVASIDDHRELERLQEKAESAHELLEKYSKHLGSEVRDRISMVHMLKSYINHHRAELSRAEEQLTEHRQKHEKVQKVRKQLQLHLDSLPDLSKLPSNTGGLAPLPSVGDLFS